MAQKLVDILAPLINELAYILGSHNNNMTYSYTLKNGTASTSLSDFCLIFSCTMKAKDKMTIKRKILKHSFQPDTCIKSLSVEEDRVTIHVKDNKGCSKLWVMDDIYEKEGISDPLSNYSILKASQNVPSKLKKKEKLKPIS